MFEGFFSTISKQHAEILDSTGKLSATKKTFTSPTPAFSHNYNGFTYKFTMKNGTTDALAEIGVRDQSKLIKSTSPDMLRLHRDGVKN